jgi:hypothetical protein
MISSDLDILSKCCSHICKIRYGLGYFHRKGKDILYSTISRTYRIGQIFPNGYFVSRDQEISQTYNYFLKTQSVNKHETRNQSHMNKEHIISQILDQF